MVNIFFWSELFFIDKTKCIWIKFCNFAIMSTTVINIEIQVVQTERLQHERDALERENRILV